MCLCCSSYAPHIFVDPDFLSISWPLHLWQPVKEWEMDYQNNLGVFACFHTCQFNHEWFLLIVFWSKRWLLRIPHCTEIIWGEAIVKRERYCTWIQCLVRDKQHIRIRDLTFSVISDCILHHRASRRKVCGARDVQFGISYLANYFFAMPEEA